MELKSGDEMEMKSFIALTFYFGIMKKENLKSYWSTDDVLHTPFPKKVMSRDTFFNIFSLLHLCNNDVYIPKGQPGYDPCRKLGTFYEFVTNIYI